MRTKDGHYVSSSWIKRDNKESRNSGKFIKYYLYFYIQINH